MENMIVIEQLPIIKAQLEEQGVLIKERVSMVETLAVTEDSVKEIKKERAELTKQFELFETQRKAVKAAIAGPYNEFEAMYNEHIALPYKGAIATLKDGIDTTEKGVKAIKLNELAEYFAELLQANGVDCTSMERWNPKVTLSVTLKALKEQARAYVGEIAANLQAIQSMDNADEILAEYKQCLNLSNAISTVSIRHKNIADEKARREALDEAKKAQQEVVAKVDAVLSPPVALEPPKMQNKIVSVKFESKSDKGEFAGREYSYFTAIDVTVGELVEVHVGNGVGKAMVVAVDVPESAVGCDLSQLKTITNLYVEKADVEENDPVKTVGFKVTASVSKLKALKKYLDEGGYKYE